MSKSNIINAFPDKAQDPELASRRGIAMSGAWLSSCVEGIQQVMGPDYEVTDTGLSLREGFIPTLDGIRERISNLSQGTENASKLKGTVMLSLGDLCLAAEAIGFKEDVVQDAVKIEGQSKHNVLQAIRVCRYFPKEKRVPGWYFSHYCEVVNHAKRFKDKPEVLERLVEEAKVGTITVTVGPDGVEHVQVEPITCAELRARLQEASRKEGEEDGLTPPTLLYFFPDDGDVRKSLRLSGLAKFQGAVVVNLDTMTVIGYHGDGPVRDLEASWFDE